MKDTKEERRKMQKERKEGGNEEGDKQKIKE